MTLQGDLSTLELADIVQNLELHRRSGTLSVETAQGTTRVYFEAGAVALIASERRPTLLDDLVVAGFVTERELAAARKARWRTRKSMGEVLVKRKALSTETLAWFTERRLEEDLAEFLALDAGAFTFTDEDVPRGVFDPEERALELRLPVGAMLFEAARRKDHWPLIRRRLPSDAAHYLAPGALEVAGHGDAELAQALLARLDGTRSVREAVKTFPHRRFEAYDLFVKLIEAGAVHALGPDDLVGLAEQLADAHGDEAWQVILDGLVAHTHHLGLLRAKVRLAGERDEKKSAAEALKLIAHVQLEAGDRRGALAELMRAGEFDPDDTAVWERTLELALADERHDEALEHGLRLVQLYRKPGLHSRACAVLETLVRLDPERWDLQRELARSRADCGNSTTAVAGLERFGKKLLAREEYREARRVQEEILRLVPGRKEAQQTLEMIDSRVYERRRAWRRSMLGRAALAAAGLFLTALAVLDARARLDYSRANRAVSRESLIEERRYDEAIARFEEVRARHPYALASLFDVRRRIRDLEEKRGPVMDAAGD
jgi:tetratricopeptide (TPR) repeat protein